MNFLAFVKARSSTVYLALFGLLFMAGVFWYAVSLPPYHLIGHHYIREHSKEFEMGVRDISMGNLVEESDTSAVVEYRVTGVRGGMDRVKVHFTYSKSDSTWKVADYVVYHY